MNLRNEFKTIITLIALIFIFTGCATSNSTVKNKNVEGNFVSFNALTKLKNYIPVKNAPLDKSVKYQLLRKPLNGVTKVFKEKSMLCLKSFNNSEFVSINNKYIVVVKGLASSLGDESMTKGASESQARVNLSSSNARFLSDFTSFVLNKKNKDIKKSTEEISKNDDKVSENGMVVERITKSKFTTDLLSQFIEHKKGNFISCMEYDLENSIFEKLKDTENKLTKEEVHSFLEEFIKGRKHKVTVIK